MRDRDRTKAELIEELRGLKEKIKTLESAHEAPDLPDIMDRDCSGIFSTLFDNANDSVFLMEAGKGNGQVIVDANRAACEIHGYTKDELIGNPIQMLDAPRTAKHVKERSERLLSGEKLFFEGKHKRKDGSTFPVEVSAQMIVIGGRSYILAIDQDITKRKSDEKKLKAVARKLRESNQKLEGFAYLASHELQSPLMILTKALSLLEEKAFHSMDAESKGNFRSASENASKMVVIIREMLTRSTLG